MLSIVPMQNIFFISITIFKNISLKRQACVYSTDISLCKWQECIRSFCRVILKISYFSLLCLGSSKLVLMLIQSKFLIMLQDNKQIGFQWKSAVSPTHLAALQHQPVMMVKITGPRFPESRQRILTRSKSGSLLLLHYLW